MSYNNSTHRCTGLMLSGESNWKFPKLKWRIKFSIFSYISAWILLTFLAFSPPPPALLSRVPMLTREWKHRLITFNSPLPPWQNWYWNLLGVSILLARKITIVFTDDLTFNQFRLFQNDTVFKLTTYCSTFLVPPSSMPSHRMHAYQYRWLCI